MVPNKGKQTLRKANGKPKEQTKTSVSKPCPVVKKESVEPAEIKENTLTFPLLKTVDNGRLMPRYTSIINRTEEEGVRFEDLDILKIELKGLLANVSVRVRVLQGELKNLANAADEKKEKKRLMLDKAPASPAKRGKYEDKPIKKLKEAPVRGRELMSSPPSIKITRVKSITVNGPVPPSAALPPEPEPPRIITPRNDNSSKFWQSLEQYCSDITPMDIKFLEECIRCREKGPDLAPIPRLGEHFASRWAKEDLRAEQEASSSSAGERRGVAGGTSALVGSRRAVAAAKGPDANGPFTQRLVSALIEENMISPKEIITEPVCKDGENITPLKPNKIVNNNTVTSATNVSLEKIVIKELEEQGLLEKDAQPKAPQNDEIMCEINRVQSELAAITAYNCKMLKQVLHMAREQLPRQELKKKLKIVDDEVRDVYKKFAAAKLRKRLPSKREKEQAWRVLKERDYLLRQLYGSMVRHGRAMVRPAARPMGKPVMPGPATRLVAENKPAVDRPGDSERKQLEKLSEKAPRPESSFGKPNCVSVVKPATENPPAMDVLLP
ncbi:transcriptional adapter 3 isoform X2 [Ischnura elegans]|nr:transcriptional adapter 3 isoform X2 [Ischnura elegans]XP_046407247.1 transcriptional adapter 3 isoform X2 [Ischnura elegans]